MRGLTNEGGTFLVAYHGDGPIDALALAWNAMLDGQHVRFAAHDTGLEIQMDDDESVHRFRSALADFPADEQDSIMRMCLMGSEILKNPDCLL